MRHPVLAGLLMLRQSVLNPDRSTPFVLTSDLGIDLGSYEDLVFGDMVKGHVARSLAKAGVAAYLRHTLALTVDDAKEVRRRLARGTP